MEAAEKSKRRILLMYITKVSGHRQGTVAIQQALKQMDSTIEAPTVNGFGYTYPLLEKIVNSAYMGVIKTVPQLWEHMYDNPRLVKNSRPIKEFLNKSSQQRIGRLFEKYKPDTIVCTQAFPCGLAASYKTEAKLNTKIIGVLTDFAPHSFWINEGVDYYVVPSQDAKERFVKKGIDPDRIKVYGIPLRPKFSVQLDKRPIAKSLGLDLNIPTVLIMGGGQGLGPIKSIVKSLGKVQMNFQVIVIAGTNKKIVEELKKESRKINKKTIVYEYANNVDELMEISSLIITKPGGLTTAESLSKGLPMVIVDPIPGQEMRNTDFLIKHDIAIRIDRTHDIGEEVELLLKSPERLVEMSKAAYQYAKPYSTFDIAKLILNVEKESSVNIEPTLENYA